MTHVVGVTVRTTASRPHLRGVVVDPSGALVRTFQHQCSKADDHEMLHALGATLATELAAQPVHAVLIREAGYARGTGLTTTVKTRFRGEGVCLSVARAVTRQVTVTDSKGIGQLLESDVATADADGVALTDNNYGDAAAAALAALKL